MGAHALTDAELDRLAHLLKHCGSKRAMNLEMLDGFLAALICSPEKRAAERVSLPEIWGSDETNEPIFESNSVLQELLSLIGRHWNVTGHILQSGEVFLPLLLNDEYGVAHANNWASGFVRGMGMRPNWLALMEDQQHGGSLIPILALAHEHDPDPEMSPYKEPIQAELREKLIIGIATGVTAIYRYFAAERKVQAKIIGSAKFFRPGARKVGRNEACPCGSGRKFKHCCGRVTFH
jgi:uncharacterized protein